jgi:hypothetical protein
MAQNLYYTPASSSLVLIRDGDISPIYWYDVDRLEISGSAYDATISGSDFGGTAASARIYAYSSSVLLISFPLEDTNLYYPPFPFPLTIEDFYSPVSTTSSFSSLSWNFTIDGIFSSAELSGSGVLIYDLTTSSSYLSYYQESANGSFPLTSGDNYLFAVSGSGSYNSYLYINDITSGSNIITLSASNAYISASYIPLPFHEYQVTFSVISTVSP